MSGPVPNFEPLLRLISRLLGWTYVLCWSLSFYPQPLSNWRRNSISGLAIDFPTINVLGFFAYAISTAAFLLSPLIRSQYAARNPLSPEPTVRFNDLAFATHAVILSTLFVSQFYCWGYKRERTQRISRPILGIVVGCVVGVATLIAVVVQRGIDGGRDPRGWAWIDVIYALGYVKLLITVVKYIPQAYVNYKRQSTVGWSIHAILLDLSGGVLSLLQLVIDSSLQGDWSGIVGNPTKLGLSNISIFFDLVFVLQHYWLYRGASADAGQVRGKRDEDDEGHRPLLTVEPDGRV